MQLLTLSRENRFSFTCPIFDTKVEFRSCVAVRDKVYVGKKLETRRGCQACVQSSKCPAAEIVRRIAFKSNDMTDHCSSTEERHGKLPADVLERIAAVMVRDSDLEAMKVPALERDLIASSRARIEAQISSAPRERVSARRIETAVSEPRKPSQKTAQRAPSPATTQPTTINKAAASGDLSAALNV